MSDLKLRDRRKTKLLPVLVFAFLLLGLGFFAYQFYYQQLLPVHPANKSWMEVRIPENSSAKQVAVLLKQKDLIRSERAFLNYCSQHHLDNQLKAGLYRLSPSLSSQAIARQLAQGQVVRKSFTIPEGFTVRQIGELLVKKQLCSAEEWEQAVAQQYNYEFLPRGGGSETNLEGFLFPDTYEFDKEIEAGKTIDGMLKNFLTIWNKDFRQQAEAKNMDIRETIIIASLIEREAQVPEERKRISGVIQNRLQKGMPLQIDATVLYSLGEHRAVVTYSDLKVNSPYNTYLNPGLPPGPIACPGQAAIDAALNPEKHSYYYYVSRGDGSHYFSRTYAEHLQAKAKYAGQ